MSRSAGAGSPLWFRCSACRSGVDTPPHLGHATVLTGRTRPYRPRPGSALGSRSTRTSYEYVCGCGHRGWSNHVTLARRFERECF